MERCESGEYFFSVSLTGYANERSSTLGEERWQYLIGKEVGQGRN
jgi:hypothetical protein